MNSKGFTLIELLGVVAILGIIALIAVPVIDNSLNKSRYELYATQIEQIEKGMEDYHAQNIQEVNDALANSSEFCKTIKELQDDGKLQLDIKNPITNENFPETTEVCVARENNNFSYYVKEN